MDEIDQIIKDVERLGLIEMDLSFKKFKHISSRRHQALLLRNWLKAKQTTFLDKSYEIGKLIVDLDKYLETHP